MSTIMALVVALGLVACSSEQGGAQSSSRAAQTEPSAVTAQGSDTPVEPYSGEDLNYNDSGSRVVYEYENPEARNVELVIDTVDDWQNI